MQDFYKNHKSKIKWVVAGFILFLCGYFLNRKFDIRVLVGDDLGEYHHFTTLNFWEFVFSYSSGRFRPISNIFVYLELFICRNNVQMIQWYNIISYAIMCSIFMAVAFKVSKSYFVSVIAAIMFSISRFSWYNVTQILGQMENSCLILLFGIVWFMADYNNNPKRSLIISSVFYTCILFCHERYFILIIPLVLYYSVRDKNWKKNIYDSLIFICIFVFYYVIKVYILKIDFAVDTGGHTGISIDVIETFKKAFNSLLNVLQVPISLDYLVGITFESFDPQMESISIFLCLFSIIILLLSVYNFFHYALNKDLRNAISLNFTLLVCMAFLIGSISVSKRIEMRFLYSSYAIFILICCCNIRFVIEELKITDIKKMSYLCLGIFGSFTVLFSVYMVNNAFPYYYIIQDNSIGNYYYEEIYLKYKDEYKDKKLLLFWENYYFQSNNMDHFLEQFEFENGYEVMQASGMYDYLNEMTESERKKYIILYNDQNLDCIYEIRDVNLITTFSDTWLLEKENTYLCYSDSGSIRIDYYIPENFENMEYSFYINGKLIRTEKDFSANNSYTFEYFSNDIIEKFFEIKIVSKDIYNPSLNGGEDTRNLQMYVVYFSSNHLPYDKVEVLEDTWLTGYNSGFYCYSETGHIVLEFYILEDFIDFEYEFLIDGKVMSIMKNFEANTVYTFDYFSEDLINELFVFSINSNKVYNPSLHGGEDSRNLQIYITNFDMNRMVE